MPTRIKLALLAGASGIVVGTLGIRLAEQQAWIRFFDNLHWTSGTAAAAIVAWLSIGRVRPEDRRSLFWIALGLGGYAVGQLLWDVQTAIGYAEFPAPSDLFYLWLGPCITIGLLLEARNHASESVKRTIWLDTVTLSVAMLTFILALYLPMRGDTPWLPLLVLIAYPLTLFVAVLTLVVIIPSLRLRPSFSLLAFLLSLLATAFSWMNWNFMALDGTAIDGAWFNISFSVAVLLLGFSLTQWKIERKTDPHWDRLCEGALRLLPLLTVVIASLAVVLSRMLAELPLGVQRAADVGAVVVIILAMVRQGALLKERDLLLTTQEALIQSQRGLMKERGQLKSLIGTIPDLIWLKDPNGVYISCNPRFEKLYGAREQEIVGKTDYDFVSRETADFFVEHDRLALRADGPSVNEEWLTFAADGYRGLFETIKTPMRDENGEVIGVLGIARDITERRAAQAALQQSERKLETMLQTLTEGVVTVDLSGQITYSNRAAQDILEIGQDISGKYFQSREWMQFDENGKPFPLDKLPLAIALSEQRRVFNIEHQIVAPNGEAKWLSVNAAPMFDESGKLSGGIASFRDITKAKHAEQQLRLAATTFESQEGMVVTDAQEVILKVNQAFTHISGYAAEEVIGKTPRVLSSGRHNQEFYAAMWQSLNETGAWSGEVWNRRKNGEIYPEELTITAVKDQAGSVVNYVGTLADISHRKAAEEEIHLLAFYDPLTRLPNRRLLLDRLKQALASNARSRRNGALLFIDLDNFKSLNDSLGHDVGDQLLQQVGERLMACVREEDTVARIGGDEFVVMLDGLSGQIIEAASQSEAVGEKILATLNQPYSLAGHEYHNTPSIGAVLFGDQKLGIDELMKHADIAMYQSKKAGRNTLRFFDPQMQEAINARVALETELRKAYEKREFRLYFQRQVNSAGRVLGAEALIRWVHPERGLISPAQFIPIAEETGMILSIGQWVLEEACAQLKAWQFSGHASDLAISVNVSAKQLRQAGFAEMAQELVQRHGINPRLLKLEITESMLVEEVENTILTMNALNEIGLQFSLDDFGTGYSSLQYLKRLPLNQLKIDQSFVRDIATDKNDRSIVRTIISIAHSLNLDVIAEGVEVPEQQQILLNKGCTHYQGYLFGKPLPIDEFEAALQIK